MENIIYNELLVRDFNVDVGVVEYRTKNAEGKQEKIIVVKDDIKPWYNEEGILVLGLQQFLLQPESMLL